MRAEDWNPAEHMHKCYSVERYKATYAHIVCPCKDKTEWAKMNGPPILPPEYKKHVGRPTRCRRKAPGEVDARGGGKRMSRHGVIMHCSYCGEPDHNINGCTWKKAGLPDPRTTSVPPPPPPDAEPVITQEPEDNTVNATIVDDLVADRMTQERTVPRQSTTGPIPDSTFLADARASLNQPQVRTTLSQGELARQLQAMQAKKNKDLEDRKIAILEAKYTASLKRAEENAQKKAEQEQRKQEQAEARSREAAVRREKKRAEAELNRKARAETRKIVAEVKKELAEKKKSEAAERKREAEEKKKADKKKAAEEKATKRARYSEHMRSTEVVSDLDHQVGSAPILRKKVNMFDEFR